MTLSLLEGSRASLPGCLYHHSGLDVLIQVLVPVSYHCLQSADLMLLNHSRMCFLILSIRRNLGAVRSQHCASARTRFSRQLQKQLLLQGVACCCVWAEGGWEDAEHFTVYLGT